MAKRRNNRNLILLFVVLALAVAGMFLYDHYRGERSFRAELFSFDPGEITSVEVFPKGASDAPIRLEKQGSHWMVVLEEGAVPADSGFLFNLFGTLDKAKPERVAGIGKSSWEEFQVTDSASTRVVLYRENKKESDFRIGKVSFSQSPQQQPYGRNRNPVIKSHIRMEGDDNVYLVDGFLSVMFQDKPSAYREKTICRFPAEGPTGIDFQYPGDSSFYLRRDGNGWVTGSGAADSAAVVTWLKSVATSSGSDFAGKEASGVVFPYRLRLEGNNMPVIEIEGARDDSAKVYLIRSTQNPSALFKATSPYLFDRLFPSGTRFKK